MDKALRYDVAHLNDLFIGKETHLLQLKVDALRASEHPMVLGENTNRKRRKEKAEKALH